MDPMDGQDGNVGGSSTPLLPLPVLRTDSGGLREGNKEDFLVEVLRGFRGSCWGQGLRVPLFSNSKTRDIVPKQPQHQGLRLDAKADCQAGQ